MQGMFKANGGCGYVKKPHFLLNVGDNNEVFDPQKELEVKTVLKVCKCNRVFPPISKFFYVRQCSTFLLNKQVKVYMGEGWHHDFRHTDFDPFSPPDFFTRVCH